MSTEEKILSAIKELLKGRVNRILRELLFALPPIDFEDTSGLAVVPDLRLLQAERTEKERIVRLDAYAVLASFAIGGCARDGDIACYTYAAAVEKALDDDPTLGGIAERAALTGKRYTPPKKPHCGDVWEMTLTLRITIEGAVW